MNSSVHSKASAMDLPLEFLQTLETSFGRCVNDYLANTLPELDKPNTAVFTSTWNGEVYPFDEEELLSKVAEEFSQLTGIGVDTIIVNTGTRYGMLALKVLASLKKETPFRLIRSKVRGEFFDEPNNIQAALLMSNCDSYVYADDADHYDEIILSRSSYVSDEAGLAAN